MLGYFEYLSNYFFLFIFYKTCVKVQKDYIDLKIELEI